ncbi:MAG: 3-dehydroquinate synthase [Alicyclobacillus sp.]|nr:3-dehydroquinate synthase [Alicyclobacillus sp.]
MTRELEVRTPTARYPVRVGARLMQEAGNQVRASGVPAGAAVLVVTDEHLLPFGYAQRVADSCRAAGLRADVAVVPPGDASKSLAQAEQLYERLLDAGVRRNGAVLAVGGGVVGDLAGFVAATYLRGVRLFQVPTTLLAHDSSIGGKVAVNLSRAKNLVGAFYHPQAVLFDVEALASLPVREWQGGMAEVIKHAILGDPALFVQLEAHPYPQYPGAAAAEDLVTRGCQVKIQVVERDEFESELRMLLNLGHTLGHAVEHVSHYTLNHGEAVAIGMRLEADIACRRGWLPRDVRDRIVRVLVQHGLPVEPPPLPFSAVVDALQLDKKHTASGWTFVLPRNLGDVAVARDVAYAEVEQAWTALVKERGA